MPAPLGSQPRGSFPFMKISPVLVSLALVSMASGAFSGCTSSRSHPGPSSVPGQYSRAEYDARVRAESRRLQAENPDMSREQARKKAQRKVDADMRSLPSVPLTKSEMRKPNRRQKQLEQDLEKMGKDGH